MSRPSLVYRLRESNNQYIWNKINYYYAVSIFVLDMLVSRTPEENKDRISSLLPTVTEISASFSIKAKLDRQNVQLTITTQDVY